MTQQHPITPPLELVHQWTAAACEEDENTWNYFATWAAQWGADQELEACIDWISVWHGLEHPELLIELLRAARRPKPPSLKRVALIHFDSYAASFETSGGDSDLIRRALEQLPDYTNEEL